MVGLPAVLKTRRLGYDGKGQAVIRQSADLERAWVTVAGAPSLIEGFVTFTRELSLIAVRSSGGDVAFYPLVENHHPGGILRRTIAPASAVDPELQARAERYATDVMNALELADRAYVIDHGRVTKGGPSMSLASDPAIREAYMGIA